MHTDTVSLGYADVVSALLVSGQEECPHAVEACDTLAQAWLEMLWERVETRCFWSMTCPFCSPELS